MADAPPPSAPPGVYGLLAALSQNGLLPPRQRSERPPTRELSLAGPTRFDPALRGAEGPVRTESALARRARSYRPPTREFDLYSTGDYRPRAPPHEGDYRPRAPSHEPPPLPAADAAADGDRR